MDSSDNDYSGEKNASLPAWAFINLFVGLCLLDAGCYPIYNIISVSGNDLIVILITFQ